MEDIRGDISFEGFLVFIVSDFEESFVPLPGHGHNDNLTTKSIRRGVAHELSNNFIIRH